MTLRSKSTPQLLDHADNRPFDTQMNRRSFLARTAVAGASIMPIGALIAAAASAEADGGGKGHLDDGDTAILRFLAAAELLEADLWQQYAELANNNPDYMAALQVIDGDMPTYVAQNTVDEFSHANFINAYLVAHHEKPVNLDPFRTLPSSPATGAQQIGRLTNLMDLTVDTTWYTRYRSSGNPDFGDTFP